MYNDMFEVVIGKQQVMVGTRAQCVLLAKWADKARVRRYHAPAVVSLAEPSKPSVALETVYVWAKQEVIADI